MRTIEAMPMARMVPVPMATFALRLSRPMLHVGPRGDESRPGRCDRSRRRSKGSGLVPPAHNNRATIGGEPWVAERVSISSPAVEAGPIPIGRVESADFLLQV